MAAFWGEKHIRNHQHERHNVCPKRCNFECTENRRTQHFTVRLPVVDRSRSRRCGAHSDRGPAGNEIPALPIPTFKQIR